jgi:probable F420-dependent oxidoreductase
MHFGVAMCVTDQTIRPIQLGRLVEEAGFESLFLPEHTHVPADGDTRLPTGETIPGDFYRFLDPIESLAAIAAVTTTLVLGTGVLVVPNHEPIMLAKRLSTLDHIANGRLVVGAGAGWNLAEMANHGADPARRWTILRERIEAIRLIWTTETAEYSGKAVHFGPIYQWPKPFQQPHPPIFVGGAGAGTAARVVAYGDGWVASGRHVDVHQLAGRVVALQALAAEAGREPIPVMLQAAVASPATIERYLEIGLTRCTFTLAHGDESAVCRQLDELVAVVEPYRNTA